MAIAWFDNFRFVPKNLWQTEMERNVRATSMAFSTFPRMAVAVLSVGVPAEVSGCFGKLGGIGTYCMATITTSNTV